MPTLTGNAMPHARSRLSQATTASGENENWLTMCTCKPAARAAAIFLIECRFHAIGRNADMAFRISADANLLDTGFAQAALLDHRQRVGKWPRCIHVAADHQEPAHIGFAAQADE